MKYHNHILYNFKLDPGNRNLLYYYKYYYPSENLLSGKTGGGGRTMLKVRYSRTFQTVLLFLIPAVLCSLAYSKVIYVDDDAAGANDGSSWENAYNFLQDALADANSAEKPIEIRIAQGVYKPDQGVNQSPGDREATFQLINSVTLKGGYTGFSKPDPNERNVDVYETVLSGDLNGNDVQVADPCDLRNEPGRAENSYHIVTGSDTDETAMLDGFTIADGSDDSETGPGGVMWSCGYGGGLYNLGGSPTLISCTFSNNWASASGGGMCNETSNPTLINCVFRGNSSEHVGGGMYNMNSNPTLTNCVFTYNYAGINGGGMYNLYSNTILTNCTFSENYSANEGGGMDNEYSNSTLINCTFFANSTCIAGGGMCNGGTYQETYVLILTDCTFIENSAMWAGGMSNHVVSPKLTNCNFSGNSAIDGGGGMHNSSSSPVSTNCTFSANSAKWGGAIESRYSSPTLNNCIISGNSAMYGGGAHNLESNLTIANCTFAQNSAQYGNALSCDSSPRQGSFPGNFKLNNCILWNGGDEIWNNDASNIEITYGDVQGVWPGVGNIDVDPDFVQAGYWTQPSPRSPNSSVWIEGDYHLKSEAGRWDPVSESWVADNVTSLCIDAGDPNSPVGDEPDPNGGRINMGAYGGTVEASKSPAYSWWFETTQGPVLAKGLGIVLPHEHIFTDLRGPTTLGYGQADAADVVRVMSPLLAGAREKGVGVLIECTSIGVGRNVAIVAQVAEASGLPVVVPTGVYGRANFAPLEHRNMTEDELTTLFISEIHDGIEGTGIKAGFIKIATDDGPMNALLEKILRAAGRAASETGAAVASHTPVGSNAVRQVDILESIDPAIRFIWVHAQNESNRNLHLQLAARGVYIEFDSLGWNPSQDSTYIAAIKNLLAAGHGDRILLSHDAGWYQPGQANGGTQKPFTYLIDTFILKLRDAGVDDATIRMITQTNPVRAFGFKSGE